MCIYIYIFIHIHIYIYIYMHRRAEHGTVHNVNQTPLVHSNTTSPSHILVQHNYVHQSIRAIRKLRNH